MSKHLAQCPVVIAPHMRWRLFPHYNRIVELAEMHNLDGAAIKVAPGSGHRVQIPLQGELAKGMVARFV